jgi:hypothetical protein
MVQAEIKNVLLMVMIAVEIGQKMLFCKDSTLMLMILCFDNWCLPDIYYPGSNAIKIQCPTKIRFIF